MSRIVSTPGELPLALLDSVDSLQSAIIAAVVMLVFSILSLFVTIFIVKVAAESASLYPEPGFIVLGAAILVAAAIVASGTGFATTAESE